MPEQNHILSDAEKIMLEAEAARARKTLEEDLIDNRPSYAVKDLAESEMFASNDETVINWKGENYYKACGENVSRIGDGGWSTCVKRENHPGDIHEDYDGRTKDEWDFGFGVLSIEEAITQAIGAGSMCWETLEGAGIFQSDRAKAISDQLIKRVRDAGPIYD